MEYRKTILPLAAASVEEEGTSVVRPGNKNNIHLETIGVDNMDEKWLLLNRELRVFPQTTTNDKQYWVQYLQNIIWALSVLLFNVRHHVSLLF